MALGDPGLPADLAQSLQTITGESRQATQLVQQVLDFSRRARWRPVRWTWGPFLKKR